MSTVDIFTGIRPTADATIANYIGAIAPVVELQNAGNKPVVFVADLHALTDKEPALARQYIHEIVADYLALGVDPSQTTIFVQSAIEPEILHLTMLLARHISASELLRVPALKDKIKDVDHPESANALLLLYPVMMAADILIQKAHRVPVGEDQVSHLEVARKLARRFNERYGAVFVEPQPLLKKSVRILSLVGEGKMSKSNPAGALLLSDSADEIAKKIKRAETAFAGEMNDKLTNLIDITKAVANDAENKQLDSLVARHLAKEAVMAPVKELVTVVLQRFIADFTEKKKSIQSDAPYIPKVLAAGNAFAKQNAAATLKEVDGALYT